MSGTSEITCLRPDQLPVWTNEDNETSSLDTLLLMAARMAFTIPDLYTQEKEYGSQVFRELTDNLLKMIQDNRSRDIDSNWFQVNVEVLQGLRDKVRRDLGKERLVGGTKIIVNSYSSLDAMERHIIPRKLVEQAFVFRGRCNSCKHEFETGPSTRTRGMQIRLVHNSDHTGVGGLQELINDLVH